MINFNISVLLVNTPFFILTKYHYRASMSHPRFVFIYGIAHAFICVTNNWAKFRSSLSSRIYIGANSTKKHVHY